MTENPTSSGQKSGHKQPENNSISAGIYFLLLAIIASYFTYCFLAWFLPSSAWTWLFGAVVVGMFAGKVTLLRFVGFCVVPVLIAWVSRNLGNFNQFNRECFLDLGTTVLPQSLVFLIIAFFAERARHYCLEYNATAFADTLTGLGNLRMIHEYGYRIWDILAADQKQCTVLFIDCDSLKAINDQLGHECGDQYLIEAASHLEKYWDDDLLLARRSGDEFIVVSRIIERAELEKQLTSFLAESISVPEGCTTQAGFSVGAVVCSPADLDFKDAIAQAEKAMYQAKRAGKNQFVIEPVAN
jgi:diguanylate cyclase (GGDEF)-like protein